MATANTGPSTAQSSYLVPSTDGVEFTSVLSAGDAVPGWTTAQGLPWRFVGTPDGIGAFDNGDGTVTVLVNHEIGAADGILRAHGAPGAFVDELVIDPLTLAVVSAGDLAHRMFLYDTKTGDYAEQASALTRLCSGDLAAPSAFYDAESGLGTQARIYLNGEEATPEGRALAWVATGPEAHGVYELPALGNFAIENLLASPYTGQKTVVMGNDDATGGQVYVYVGEKQADGSEIDKAGLTDGQLYGIKAGFAQEAAGGTPLSGDFTLAPLGDAKDLNGAQLQTASEQAGATGWLRPEDGAWDTVDHNRYYFHTTASVDGPSRLWALDFKDASRPELGGAFTALLDGTEGHKMLDNMAVSADGTLILQEDVGNNPRAGKVWHYDPATDKLTEIAHHDVARFGDETTPATVPFTQDEESSGVVDVTDLFPHDRGQHVFLLDTQAHYPFGLAGSLDKQEIVEDGQLMLMTVDAGAAQGWHLPS
jgi:serralysin